ncbi:MAG: hypothetical protein H6704_03045 [Myxococcales bacterium]|nr:hypothetical protein [Myxococcales bacterium]
MRGLLRIFGRRPRRPISFEQQLATLASCGIRLAPGVPPEALLASFDREAMEDDPYVLLLTCMGAEEETVSAGGATAYMSNDIWHFDTECIEDHGDYSAIARRMSELAQGDLPLDGIADYVDIDAGQAHLSFELAGQRYRWDAKVEDDWVDPAILSKLASLLTRVGSSRRFTYIDLGGQGCLIGCATGEERKRLARETGLVVKWLT